MEWNKLGYAFMLSVVIILLGYSAYNLGITARTDTNGVRS